MKSFFDLLEISIDLQILRNIWKNITAQHQTWL